MQIGAYKDQSGARWDQFVSAHTTATFFHLFDWFQFLAANYGHRPHLLVAEDGGEIVGCLPLVEVRAPILGSKLISIPYQASAGGTIADDDEVALSLLEHAKTLGRELKAGYVELRGGAHNALYQRAGFVERHQGTVDSTAPIVEDTRKTLVRGHRQDINRVARLGIEITEANSIEEWRTFYEMFEAVQRSFAAIGFGWAFFENLHARLPSKAKVRLARLEGEIIGGSLILCHDRTIFSKQTVVPAEHVRTGIGKGLVFSSIEWGRENGFEHFNLGITLKSQPAVLAFKEGFGAVPRPISSYVLPLRSEPPSFEDLYEGYGLAKRLWVKLPLPATKLAGTLLTRWFC